MVSQRHTVGSGAGSAHRSAKRARARSKSSSSNSSPPTGRAPGCNTSWPQSSAAGGGPTDHPRSRARWSPPGLRRAHHLAVRDEHFAITRGADEPPTILVNQRRRAALRNAVPVSSHERIQTAIAVPGRRVRRDAQRIAGDVRLRRVFPLLTGEGDRPALSDVEGPVADTVWRHSTSELPRVARGSSRNVESWALSRERKEPSSPRRSYVTPVGWCTTSRRSETEAGSTSASRVAIAVSRRAAFAVAALGRTRRSRSAAGTAAVRGSADSAASPSAELRTGPSTLRRCSGLRTSSWKRASASSWPSTSNHSSCVRRPSVPKTQSRRKHLSKAPPPVRRAPKVVQQKRNAGAQADDVPRPRTSKPRGLS